MVSQAEYARRRAKIAADWIRKHPSSKIAKDAAKKTIRKVRIKRRK